MSDLSSSKSNRAVVISGASSGIGRASAIEFSKQGYFVFLLGRDPARLNETAGQLTGESLAVPCDLSQLTSTQQAIKKIFSQTQVEVEVLINNAGIFQAQSFEESTDEVWLEQFNVNLFGSVRLTREFFPYFKSKRRGSIVNVSSTLGLSPTAGTSAYSASKAAMVSWTQSLALEGGPFKIRCNCVCPGLVDTPIHKFHHFEKDQKDLTLQNLNKLQPLGRIGEAHEIAEAIFFLGSEKSSWTTGAILSVDGGINLQ